MLRNWGRQGKAISAWALKDAAKQLSYSCVPHLPAGIRGIGMASPSSSLLSWGFCDSGRNSRCQLVLFCITATSQNGSPTPPHPHFCSGLGALKRQQHLQDTYHVHSGVFSDSLWYSTYMKAICVWGGCLCPPSPRVVALYSLLSLNTQPPSLQDSPRL